LIRRRGSASDDITATANGNGNGNGDTTTFDTTTQRCNSNASE
jgi:hypothetical protein